MKIYQQTQTWEKLICDVECRIKWIICFDETEYDAANNVTWFKKTITVAGSNVGKQ
ncbi:MAG: hypothetical protein ACLUVO_07670 [Roseburia sp.]